MVCSYMNVNVSAIHNYHICTDVQYSMGAIHKLYIASQHDIILACN